MIFDVKRQNSKLINYFPFRFRSILSKRWNKVNLSVGECPTDKLIQLVSHSPPSNPGLMYNFFNDILHYL